MNALVTRGESSMAVIINDVIEDKMRDATESSHEATVKTEGKLRSVNKERKKTGARTGDILKSTAVTIKLRKYVLREEEAFNCSIGIGLGIGVFSISIGIGCKNLVSVHH